MKAGICAGLMLALAAGGAAAEGDPTRRAERLEPVVLDAAEGFSVKEYQLETGVYYRWRIESDGLEEYKLVAPEFFGEIWVDQVVVEDLEVKPSGLRALEFDDAGQMDVWFVPIRPGSYEFWVEGLRTQGFSGRFEVR